MKKILILSIIICIASSTFGQENITESDEYVLPKCFTMGFLQGGGSLIGADAEVLFPNHLGFQIGAGYLGFGGGVNYHFNPSIRSSFLSFQYWHQGIFDKYTQSVASMNYVYRGKQWFTFQIGAGVPLERGPNMPEDFIQPPVMLTYAIGFYLPTK